MTPDLIIWMLNELASGKYFTDLELPFSRWSLYRSFRKYPRLRMTLILIRKLRAAWNAEMRRHGMSRRRAHRWEPFRNTGEARRAPRRRVEYSEHMIELVAGSPYRTTRRLGVNTYVVNRWAAEHREFALALVERANKATRARIDAEIAFEEIQRLKVQQDRGWSPTGSFRDET